jgi:hypothetical protein
VLFGAAAVLALAGICQSQLSGTYTINPTSTGTRNFKTFGAAISMLGNVGVSGPVVLNVTTGVFKESWQIPIIKGTSKTNTVTFQGMAPTPSVILTRLQGGTTHIIDLLKGTNNIVISGFDFVSTVKGLAIIAADQVTNIEIKNCRFGTGIIGDAAGRGHIYVNGLDTSNDWSIHDNEFNFGAYKHGIFMARVRRHLMYRNRFRMNGTEVGVYWTDLLFNSNQSRNIVYNNLFTGKTSTSVNACAINMAGGSVNNDICFNTISINTDGYAIWAFGFQGGWNRFYGNIISVTGKTGGGIYITVGSRNWWQSDGNLYFIQSGVIGRIVARIYKGLINWQTATGPHPNGAQDMNSVEGDPKFRSATDFHLLGSSPAIGKAATFKGYFVPKTDYDGWVRGTKLDMGLYETTGYRPYGQGCPGTGNKTPVLSFAGNIGPGDMTSMDLTNARANSRVALTVGLNQATIGLGGSCTLLNQPLILLFMQSSATGTVSLPATISSSTVILGATVYVQYGVADPAAPGGIAVTEGAGVRI